MMEQTKAELRKQYKQKRRALTPEQVTAASAQIRKRFMNSDGYKDCNHLLIYVSQDNEVAISIPRNARLQKASG